MLSFKWRHFKQDIILILVRRYLAYSLRKINRWVICYSPQLEEVLRKRYKRPVGISLRMHETCIKVKGQTVDFMLPETSGIPNKVTVDKTGTNKADIDTINLHLVLLFLLTGVFIQITIRQIKYLNIIVEQDRRFVKKTTNTMKGFKSFHSAEATLSGIQLHHMIRKSQHKKSENKIIFEQFYGLAA